MKKRNLKAMCVGLAALTVIAAGGAVGIAAIATNGFKNNENITPNLSMNFVNYGKTYTKQGVESALVGAGYEIKDLKLRSYLDADYWQRASFKENKANFLTKTELKAFTDEDHEKSITLNNVAQNAYGSWLSQKMKVSTLVLVAISKLKSLVMHPLCIIQKLMTLLLLLLQLMLSAKFPPLLT